MSDQRRIMWIGTVRALPLREQLRAAAIARCHSITVHSAKTCRTRHSRSEHSLHFALAPLPIAPPSWLQPPSERRKSQDLVG
jgi:hypothetical protein